VSPSAYEGFGFAVADALAAGVPTVVSAISSLPELCGDAALQLPRLDAAAVAEALDRLLGDPALAASLRQRGPARAATFTWQAAAAGHVQAYRRAAGG
jgi:glycosyltransferase involved in cell wall biosynthesis